ncbi:unnamed protein product [Mycena citricolor]|uniref:YTH domain-containing protein n=1 Tax=Mycena citricolor TaxID=2018698 RepID=A0AAD2H898_9AGAR|nr:unnamed protein product [Mycena citricolor]CAK5283839.1 unnamed protein product [Mycena citricolor]
MQRPFPPRAPISSQPVRRSYHPAAPTQRSQWAMWVGNVPKDADQDELHRFFTQPLGDGAGALAHGVQSIFVLPRSNCAFVNYNSESALTIAIASFNGVSLRTFPQQTAVVGKRNATKPLICRARMEEHDLFTGVGGQRGVGLHSTWVKERRARNQASATEDNSDTISNASTTSSLLQENFPQRFFMLKSYKQDDLDSSVDTGLWNAQRHNAEVLDRAFRTSEDVFLFFSVNKSGEFYGYARMTGPITPRGVPGQRHESFPHTALGAQSPSSQDLPPPETFLPPALLDEIEAEPEFDFPLHWMCVDRMRFSRTKHIHNPWNQDREVKISRDGMEIEPEAGQAVLDIWKAQRATLIQAPRARS